MLHIADTLIPLFGKAGGVSPTLKGGKVEYLLYEFARWVSNPQGFITSDMWGGWRLPTPYELLCNSKVFVRLSVFRTINKFRLF